MKKKQNLLLLILAVLFVSLFGGSTAVSAASRFHGCRRSRLERLSARIIICIIVMAREITPETNI